jgi:hypothetical protein
MSTLIIILTADGLIFTPIAWDSNSGWKSDESQKSLLFIVKNPSASGDALNDGTRRE